MAGKKSARQWTFDATRDVVAWLEAEAMNEVTLEDVEPSLSAESRGAPPTSVRFTWVLHGTGVGREVPYEVVAEGVQAFALEGDRDEHAISIVAGEMPGVHLVFEVPGRLTLRCQRLSITRRRARKKAVPERRHTDYAYFVVAGLRGISVADVIDALDAPPGAELVLQPPSVVPTDSIRPRSPAVVEVRVDGRSWVKVYNMNARGEPGYSLSVSRQAATDDEWRRAQDLPTRLGPSRVVSAWEFEGTDAEWAAMLTRASAVRS